MASIRKTRTGKYNVQVRLKGKLFASATLKTRELAVKWGEAKEKELQLRHPLFLDAGYLFARLKDWRRIATRCDRCGELFLSAICIAATVTFWSRVLTLDYWTSG